MRRRPSPASPRHHSMWQEAPKPPKEYRGIQFKALRHTRKRPPCHAVQPSGQDTPSFVGLVTPIPILRQRFIRKSGFMPWMCRSWRTCQWLQHRTQTSAQVGLVFRCQPSLESQGPRLNPKARSRIRTQHSLPAPFTPMLQHSGFFIFSTHTRTCLGEVG